ncbi:hypothetical protein [Subtercola vilae]|uniref:Uncharacterized protein n=1 Tax=Subtercola vilae TaxID=2056433 RepID=A0A4V4RER2_9MICO|nr:hypothetical protein [Subtercola vilae]TIH34984.1 hypothetical protein D4765_11870 [Subtercola vilae]
MTLIPLDWFKYLFGDTPIAPVVLTFVAITVLGVIAYRVWPVIKRLVSTLTALEKLPDFMDKQESFRQNTTATLHKQDESLASQDVKIQEIHHEVNYNNGTSVKDAVERVEEGVAGWYVAHNELRSQLGLPAIDTETPIKKKPPRKRAPRIPKTEGTP